MNALISSEEKTFIYWMLFAPLGLFVKHGEVLWLNKRVLVYFIYFNIVWFLIFSMNFSVVSYFASNFIMYLVYSHDLGLRDDFSNGSAIFKFIYNSLFVFGFIIVPEKIISYVSNLYGFEYVIEVNYFLKIFCFILVLNIFTVLFGGYKKKLHDCNDKVFYQSMISEKDEAKLIFLSVSIFIVGLILLFFY